MANVIDEFIIELGLDPTKFNKGQKDSVDSLKKLIDQLKRGRKEVENSEQQLVAFFSTLKTQAVSLAATFVEAVGVKDFIQNITGTGIALDRTARFTGESVRELSAWRNVSEQAGGSADATTASMLGLTQSLQNFQLTGESSVIPYFRALGISLTDAQGHFKTASQLFLDLAGSQRLKNLDPRRAAVILQALGLDPATTNLILTNSRAQLAAKLKLAQTNAFTEKDLALAKQFTQQFKEISQEATRVGQNIFIVMAPALKDALSLVKDFVDFLKSNQYIATGFFLALSGVISSSLIRGALTPLLLVFRALSTLLRGQVFLDLALLTSKFIPALGDAFLALGAKIEASQLGRILGALALVIAAAEAYEWVNKKLNSSVGIKEPTFGDVIKSWKNYVSGKRLSTFSSGGGDLTSFSETGGSSRSPGYTPYTGGKSAQNVIAYFQAKGWSREQAIGLAANLKWESGLDPKSVGDQGSAHGLAQWHRDRLTPFAARYGTTIDSASLAQQLDFINYELTKGGEKNAGRALAGAKSVEDATRIVAQLYERPASLASLGRRQGIAAQLASAPVGSRLAAANNTNNSRSTATTVHIGTIEVHNPKDASQVAANVRTELARNIFAGNANNGAQ